MAAIKLLLFTGCRKGEILSLQWEQVKLEENRLYLPITKTGSRSVMLNNKAREVLECLHAQRVDGDKYLFKSRAGSRKPFLNDIRKPFLKVCLAADIENLRIHDLRHSFASFCVMGGSSLYEVSKLLGHSDSKMSERYSHLSDDSLQKASDNVSNIIDQVINS